MKTRPASGGADWQLRVNTLTRDAKTVSNECRETTNGHGGLTVLYLDGIFLDLRAAKSKTRESRAGGGAQLRLGDQRNAVLQ